MQAKPLNLNKLPGGLLRYGRLIIVIGIVLLVVVLYVFKVKEKVSGTVTINSLNRPQSLYAASDGVLVPLIGDGDSVQRADVVAYVDGRFSYNDIIDLAEALESERDENSLLDTLLELESAKPLEIGLLSTPYLKLRKALFERQLFDQIGSLGASQALSAKRTQLAHIDQQIGTLSMNDSIVLERLRLSEDQLARQQTLYDNEVISKESYEEALDQKLSYEQDRASASSELQQLGQERSILYEQISLLRAGRATDDATVHHEVQTALSDMRTAIAAWRYEHELRVDIQGVISYAHFVTGTGERLRVKTGDHLATVVPSENNAFIGLMRVPPDGIGQVQHGMNVRILLRNYPYMQYGALTGRVQKISQVAVDGEYNVWIGFDETLNSTYDRNFPFMQGMEGKAEIIVMRQSLLQKAIRAIRWRLSRL